MDMYVKIPPTSLLLCIYLFFAKRPPKRQQLPPTRTPDTITHPAIIIRIHSLSSQTLSHTHT